MTSANPLKTNPSNDNSDGKLLPVGTTLEVGRWRFHRYSDSLRITDLENAGKRGKKCTVISVGHHDGWLFSLPIAVSESIVSWTTKESPSRDTMVYCVEAVGQVEIKEERGIDVDPPNDEVEVLGPMVTGHFSARDFAVTDATDSINESRIIHLDSFGRRNAAAAHKWAKANLPRLTEMTLEQVKADLRNNRIKFHSYCGMD